MKRILSFFILILAFNFALKAQNKSSYTSNKAAIKSFNKAVAYMEQRQNKMAIAEIDKAIEKDSNFLEAWLLRAEIYDFLGNVNESYSSYVKVFEIDENYDPALSFKLAANSYKIGKYSDAKNYIDFFYNEVDTIKYKNYDFRRLKEFIYFADNAYNNPKDFKPINIGPGVNTQFDEYWPSLSVDESILVFTRQIPINPNSNSRNPESMHEDLFVSYFDEKTGQFSRAIPMPGNVNTKLNEGAQCISADGKTCVITACNRPDGKGSCDLYIMFLENGKWTNPKNLESINTSSWESNPSLSADGKYLYFSSGRPGGYGKTDIYRQRIDEKGNALGEAENLGTQINTAYEELSPFIHPDGKTLYFASRGHPGMGDFDLFYSKLDDNGNWSKPVNLGYPINTLGEERSLIVNARGDIAMFASNAGKRDLDIYFFLIPEEIKPKAVTYVKGYVYDIKTNQRLEAKCELFDIESGEEMIKLTTDKTTGEYLVTLPLERDYAFNVEKSGYLFHSENFSLKNIKNPEDAFILNIPLQPLEEGVRVVLKNIFFEFNSYELLQESFAELKVVVDYLNSNPNLKIEIGGHTDNVGTKAYNKTLSENRAKSVYTYLISKGIDKNRLSFKGYDFSVAIADNETEEGRALNRRTEFKVISNK
ncbi:MAG: OmpA family protein [Bacteroidales bacterium]|nr:OmpA family protein [Bacteroidales bacterium]MCK9498424.1 OmpA family protein [Bacteroidales bacterium]MDY0315345.1 OmpA family protein [Bacteroidales bacterium]